MDTLLAAVAVAAVTGLLGILAAAVTGLLGLAAGAYLEHVRSKEWAKKEAWAYKRQTYEETFNLLGEILWWLAWEETWEERENASTNLEEELAQRSRKLLGLLFRMEVFLNEEARKAVDDYRKKLRVAVIADDKIADNKLGEAIDELGEKLTTAARTDLDFSSS